MVKILRIDDYDLGRKAREAGGGLRSGSSGTVRAVIK
jgi:hypothetical protein